MGDARAAVETQAASRRRNGEVTSGAGAVESRSVRAEEGFPRCRTISQAFGCSGAQIELRTDVEQRLWRTIMRRKHQLTRNRVQFQNRLECLLEEAHIKLSSLV